MKEVRQRQPGSREVGEERHLGQLLFMNDTTEQQTVAQERTAATKPSMLRPALNALRSCRLDMMERREGRGEVRKGKKELMLT